MKQQFAAKHPWTILAAGAAIQVLTGLPAAWGVFQQPVMEEYGLSEQGAGYAFGILIAAFGVGCVLGGFLQDRHGPLRGPVGHRPALRRLFCGGPAAAGQRRGVLSGVQHPGGAGHGVLYPSIQSCAQKWYADRKGLATGVIGGAVGLSGAFLTVFVRTAVRGFWVVQGIRGAFWALGGRSPCRYALWAVCFCRTRRRPGRPKNRRRTAKNTIDLAPQQMLRTKQYWLCAGAVCFSTPQCCCSAPLF